MRPPVVVSIAGSDPSGGAGLQADLRTCTALGAYAGAIPTCITVQDTAGVRRVEALAGDLVREQIDVVLADLRPDAIKIGLLPSVEVVEAVAGGIAAHGSVPVVLDPVQVATSGDGLSSAPAYAALIELLLPRATLVTPNLAEAASLAGFPVTGEADLERAARAIRARGARAVLVKGGHLAGDALDVLLTEEDERVELRARRIPGPPIHGTGCTLSTAIAVHLARGMGLTEAVRAAKHWVAERITAAVRIGRGAAVLPP
jgi:hydroxymethylpyrimidine/phosphomethylpyrimidine kinase